MAMTNPELKSMLKKEEDPFPDILGQEDVKKQVRSALFMDRHIIIIGPPGIGKTTLAKNIASLLPKSGKKEKNPEGQFIRVQGSPDLTAEDLVGDIDPIRALKFGPLSKDAFTPGKIFRANKGLLFFDELNRCPEKLQNSLLQVLEEQKATIGCYDVDFKADFIFIGTMNPEDTSTEKLSDVFLDRFDIIYMQYPETTDIEKQIVLNRAKKLDVTFDDELLEFSVNFVRHLREGDKLEKKPSVRASIGLYERASANALLSRRKEVSMSDVKEAINSVISHRIRLKPSLKYLQSPTEFVNDMFESYFSHFSHKAGTEKEGDVP